MERIGTYSTYRKLYDKSVKGQKKNDMDKDGIGSLKNQKIKKNEKQQKVTLSAQAKELLKKLQKKYGNMDFIIADYESDEEASALLSRGTKEFSVLIDPETLEQMAADEEIKEKYTGLIEESIGTINNMKEQLGEAKEDVSRFGISIGKDGTISFFSELEKISEEKSKKTFVKADTIEELLEMIKETDWSKIEEKTVEYSGNRIDFSV